MFTNPLDLHDLLAELDKAHNLIVIRGVRAESAGTRVKSSVAK